MTAEQTAPPVPAPDADLSWARVHPVTPLVRGWKVLVVVMAILTQQFVNDVGGAQDALELVGVLPFLGLLVLVGVIGFVWAVLAWRMTRYAVDAEAVHLRQGVVFRQQRTARLDRIQAIDVVQPLLARIFGLSEIKIEVAGGGDSAVSLAFLKEEAAQALRNELLARAAGVRIEAGSAASVPAAPERQVFEVTTGRIIGSLVRSGAAVASVLSVAGVVAAGFATRSPAVALSMAPVLWTVGYVVQRVNREIGFRAALSPDGIRLRHGFTSARAQTVPPGRVQAVRLTQPLLWRGKDWWRVRINVAGYGLSDQETGSVLLPVGDREEALLALWLVLPDLGTGDPRAVLEAGLSGDGTDGGFVTSPRRARWLDPLAWRRNGFALTDRALLLRSGRLVRELVVVPHERTQSLGAARGPLQRRLDLVSVVAHSTPGPVSPRLDHLDTSVAAVLLDEQARRARTARAAAGPERWMLEMQAQAEHARAEQAQAEHARAEQVRAEQVQAGQALVEPARDEQARADQEARAPEGPPTRGGQAGSPW